MAYLVWRVLRLRCRLEVRLKTGERILFRPFPAEDHAAARSVFVFQEYAAPCQTARPMRRIVDLGAHIGCSCLFWLRVYPGCRVEAFEPHPAHVEILRENLQRNGVLDRVKLHEAAAGVREGSMFLSNQGVSSRLSADYRPGHHRVEVVDFFETVGCTPIDLLKIDVEGSEYALLADARFSALQTHAIVMEWHPTVMHPAECGAAWCRQQLTRFGYEVAQHKGLIWAWRD